MRELPARCPRELNANRIGRSASRHSGSGKGFVLCGPSQLQSAARSPGRFTSPFSVPLASWSAGWICQQDVIHANGCKRDVREAEIESELGDILETVFELDEWKLKSENGIQELRGRDSRRTLIDRKLLF